MAKPVIATDAFDPRLIGVDLPRVDVENIRLTAAEDASDALPEDGVGNEPEVAAAAPRERLRADLQARDRHFVEPWAQLDDRLLGRQSRQLPVPVMGDDGKRR